MRFASAGAAAGLLVLAATAAPAAAQEINARVGKLEGEMRAVQRKVFPGGAGQYVQPDIAPEQTPPGPGPGTPSSSPVIDLSQRVSSLESQMATLTGQIEQNQYHLRQLEEEFSAYRRANDARLATGGAAPMPSPGTGASPRSDADTVPAAPPPGADPAARPMSGRGSAATPSAVGDAAPAARVGVVERPSTGVPDEDAYLYGYRLWEAKQYSEAEAQLKDVVATYPKSKRASYAQNLLGRAYLDEGKPSLASIAFYDSYKKFPDGERAPDSLFYLAGALMKLNKPADACKVYGELSDVYGGKITAKMKADVAKGRVAAKCG